MEQQFYELLRQCTVRVSVLKVGHGTGFFVAPGLILTCAHVVKEAVQAGNTSVTIYWQEQLYTAQVTTLSPESDLALLQVNLADHPCVFLDEEAPRSRDPLHSYGYPDKYPEGDTLTAEYEGWTYDTQPLLKFKEGQVRPGLSGAPLLNERTGTICGIIRFSRNRESDLGGRATPVATVFKNFPILVAQQQQFHREDRRWTDFLKEVVAHAKRLIEHRKPRTYIPFPRNPLFQPRSGEFEQLETLLFGSETEQKPMRLGLVGVIGMGGVGKTQLAIELAYRCLAHFPAGVFWMPAAGKSQSDWQQQFAELAINTEYLSLEDDPSNPENELRRARYFCRYLTIHKDALLILDNVENPDLVNSVLPSLAGGEVVCPLLYTSRSRQAPPGVITHSVEPLSEEGALRLLLETTRPSLLSEVLAGNQSSEARATRMICQGVGYLPLALVHLRGLLARDRQVMMVRLAAVLRQRGVLDMVKTQFGDANPLFETFRLSWEQVSNGLPGVFRRQESGELPHLFFIDCWTQVVERRMATLSIVKTFNICKDLLPGLRSTFEGTSFNTFSLECAEEALHSRVIITVTHA